MTDRKITLNDVKDFVTAAHGDLAKVKAMLAEKPGLRDRANGNETALGAACQMRFPAMVELLLAAGAVLDLPAACVLGRADTVAAMLDADPSLLTQSAKHAHGKKPLYFAENQPEVLALLRERGAK